LLSQKIGEFALGEKYDSVCNSWSAGCAGMNGTDVGSEAAFDDYIQKLVELNSGGSAISPHS